VGGLAAGFTATGDLLFRSVSSTGRPRMAQNKARKDRSIEGLVVGAFAIAIVLAIGWVILSQSGAVAGDAPTQQDGVSPGTIPEKP